MRITPRKGVEEITKPTDISVTDGDIRRYSRLKGPQQGLDKIYGEGGWGDKEVKDYIQTRKFAEYTKQREKLAPKPTPVEERLATYLEAYEVLTPNDEEMLRAMADIEVRLEAIRRLLDDETSATKIKKLAESQTKLLTEHRQLQTILGIDKAGRERGRKTKSALDEIEDLVAEGARFIEEQLTKVTHCGIQIGWLLHDFPEMGYRLETKCPRCGDSVTISVEQAANLKDL